MPPVKKQAVEALKWDAFPEPPPEANDWEPDLDSIARPGAMKDPRFNKDEHQVARMRAARDGFSGPLRNSSPLARYMTASSSVKVAPANELDTGKWPPQILRQSKPEKVQPLQVPRQHKPENVRPLQAPRQYTPESAQPHVVEPDPPVKPTTKETLPTWAGTLEKALSEDTSQAAQRLDKSNTFKSTTPTSLHKLNEVTKEADYKSFNLDEDFKSACEATRRASISAVAAAKNYPDNDSTRSNKAVDGSTASSELHETSKISNPPHETDQYKSVNHYLKVSLVLTMQKDLWEHDLLKLSIPELDKHMLEVSSIHEKFWQAKHGGLSRSAQCNGNGP